MTTERNRRVRIADVAEAAGVSKTAVSFAFNSPERLSDETATRIRDIADQLGYRPDPVARMLSQGRTRTIGVLTPQPLAVVFSNPFFGALAEGIGLAAEESGFALYLISPLHGSLARAVGRASVDGFVAIGLSAAHPEVEQVRRAGLPIVLVDSTAMPDYPSVSIDDEAGAAQAAEHLLGLGHRDFLAVAIDPPVPFELAEPDSVTGRRLAGYRRALAGAGLDLPDDRVVTAPATVAGGAVAFRRAWEQRSATDGRPGHERRDRHRGHARRVRAGDRHPRLAQRRRLRRRRHGRLRQPTPDHGPPAGPAQGRGGGPPPARRRGGSCRRARAPPAGDPHRRQGVDRFGAHAIKGGERGRDLVIADAAAAPARSRPESCRTVRGRRSHGRLRRPARSLGPGPSNRRRTEDR